MTTQILIDFDSIHNGFQRQRLELDLPNLARNVRKMGELAAQGDVKIEAYGTWDLYHGMDDDDDATGAKEALRAEGIAVIDKEKRDMVQGIMKLRKERDVRQVIVVTDSKDILTPLGLLVEDAEHELVIRIWGTEMAATDLRKSPYPFTSLQDYLEGLQRKTVAVFIDAENVISSIAKEYPRLSVPEVIEIIRAYAGQKGMVLEMRAYGDFAALARALRLDLGDLLASLDESEVKIEYVGSVRGKNSSDLKITNDLKEYTENPEDVPDHIILVSSDRDFATIMGDLRKRRCQVTLLGVRSSTSHTVKHLRGIRVEYLDDLLPKIPQKPAQKHTGQGLALEVRATCIVNEAMQQNRWKFITFPNVVRALVDFGIEAGEAQDAARQLQANKLLLTSPQRPGTFVLNREHETVDTVVTIRNTVVRRVGHAHMQRGFPTVDEKYLVNGLGMDTRLLEKGIALSDSGWGQWLDLLVASQVLAQEEAPDGRRKFHLTNYEKPSGIQEHLTPDDLDTMVKRVITAHDSYTLMKRMPWMPIKTLDTEMTPFGRTVFQEAIRVLTNEGAAVLEKYENSRAGGQPVTGIALNAEADIIAQARDERNNIIAHMQTLMAAEQAITARALHEGQGIGETECEQWLRVLHGEKLLTRAPGAEATYALNITHALAAVEVADQGTPISPAPNKPIQPFSTQPGFSRILRRIITASPSPYTAPGNPAATS